MRQSRGRKPKDAKPDETRYVSAGGYAWSPSVDGLRFSYLEAVADRDPSVLADLKASVFPAYVDALERYGSGSDADAFLARRLTADEQTSQLGSTPATFSLLCAALSAWAKRHRLDDDWCVRAAVAAMAEWSASSKPPAKNAVDVVYRLVKGMREQLREVPPTAPSEAVGLSWGIGGRSFSSTVKRSVVDRVRARRTRIARTVRKRGFSPAVRALRRHFDWTVRYQIEGKSFGEIAETPGQTVSARAVEKAVKALAQKIGLQLRPHGKGGPRNRS
jgi:hypothetical protein